MKKFNFNNYYGDLKIIPYHQYKPNDNEYILREEVGVVAPPENQWVGYGSTPNEYLISGKEQMQTLVYEINKLLPLKDVNNFLDFGCAAGRMTRYAKDFFINSEI